jgi:hypothetical protein
MKDTTHCATSQADAKQPIPTTVAESARQRLAREGITTVSHWRALGAKRRQIFGVTARMVREIDAAVKAAT